MSHTTIKTDAKKMKPMATEVIPSISDKEARQQRMKQRRQSMKNARTGVTIREAREKISKKDQQKLAKQVSTVGLEKMFTKLGVTDERVKKKLVGLLKSGSVKTLDDFIAQANAGLQEIVNEEKEHERSSTPSNTHSSDPKNSLFFTTIDDHLASTDLKSTTQRRAMKAPSTS